jgi:hypothetical protein
MQVINIWLLTNRWGTCKTIEWGFLHQCKQDGTLTPEGIRAKDCISNFLIYGWIGLFLPTDVIIGILEPASLSLWDCDGIFNWQVKTAMVANFVKLYY